MNNAPFKLPDKLAPAPFYAHQPSDAGQRGKYEQARLLGDRVISQGKVAAFVVAGGQGTRLGFDGPKELSHKAVKNKTLLRYSPRIFWPPAKNIIPGHLVYYDQPAESSADAGYFFRQ
jgi:UDP-N-acetylglucosamine/UDP-N-acetylgalactosamine diphosphorylase